jgi:hypothetical protein
VEAGDKRWKGPDPPVSSDQEAIQPSEPLYNGSVNKRGFRAAGIVEALEENLGRPILTANQAAFWQALALSGSSQPIVGTGGCLASGCRSHNSRKPLGFRGGGRR